MKVMLIGDSHAGVKSGNDDMMTFQIDYMRACVDYCVDNNIPEIWCFGDIFEVRKTTDTKVAYRWKYEVFNYIQNASIVFRTLVGNHDSYYKNTIKINTVKMYLSDYNNVHIYEHPTQVEIANRMVSFIPWMCKDNYDSCVKMIQHGNADIILGHFECKGAKMESGECEEGLPLSMFDRFSHAFSGHFHVRGKYDNMLYVGTPFETSWADYGENKGIHILDLDNDTVDFLANPGRMFYKVVYDEDRDMDADIANLDLSDKYVRVIIENRENFPKYEKWFMSLELMCPKELKVVEPMMERCSEDSDVEVTGEIQTIDTNTLIDDYVRDVYPERHKSLSKMMQSLHNEAVRIMQ